MYHKYIEKGDGAAVTCRAALAPKLTNENKCYDTEFPAAA